jgi:hypothetical protein
MISMPMERLFSVNVGALDVKGIRDPQLRARTDQVATSVGNMLLSAGLAGRLELTHAVQDKIWVVNVDAETKLHETLRLFEQASDSPVAAIEAARRVTDHAVAEIRRFMAEQQAVNLATVQQTEQQIRRLGDTEGLVISALQHEPQQTMKLTTRDGTLILSLQGSEGETISEEVIPVECRIVHLGRDEAIISLPAGKRQGVPQSAGKRPKVRIPGSLSEREVLLRVYDDLVWPKRVVVLHTRYRKRKKTGLVFGLELDKWPSDE